MIIIEMRIYLKRRRDSQIQVESVLGGGNTT
jgi:hypothetical protein